MSDPNLAPAPVPKKKAGLASFKRLLAMMLRYWPWYLFVLAANTVGVGLELTPGIITRYIIDDGLLKHDFMLVVWLALTMIGLTSIRAVLNYAAWVVSENTGQKIIYDLRTRLHHHMQNLSPRYFAQMQTGQIMSRLTGDVDAVQNFVGFGIVMVLQVILMFTVVICYLLSLDWRLTLVSLITVPFLFATVARFDRRIQPAWEGIREAMGKLTTSLQESISGVRVVKAFAREGYEMDKFAGRNRGHYHKNIDRAGIEAGAQPLMDLLSNLCGVILIGYGGYEVLVGRMTIGGLLGFQQMLWGLVWPVRMLGWLVNDMEKALAAVPRLTEILDQKPEIANSADAAELPTVRGEIRFENVSFAFDGKDEVLHDLNLSIAAGETVAVIGGTGSGKSTFINLIPRFHDPSTGRITIDGHDVHDVTLSSLRRQIGIVLQETFLFSATIAENIAYGRPDATEEEIRAAAAIAQAAEFIEKMPKGYKTRVGERGVGLSGGQKQRVALARALLMDPRILILDEATASVDTETEYLIQEGLEDVMRDRTTLIIAKRLSTILSADKVIVLQGGTIAEFGTHAELLAQGGLYKRIFDGQFARASDVAAALDSVTAQVAGETAASISTSEEVR